MDLACDEEIDWNEYDGNATETARSIVSKSGRPWAKSCFSNGDYCLKMKNDEIKKIYELSRLSFEQMGEYISDLTAVASVVEMEEQHEMQRLKLLDVFKDFPRGE